MSDLRVTNKPARMMFLFALTLAALLFSAKASHAQNATLADLKGQWVLSLNGGTSCGFVDMRAVATFTTTGKANNVSVTTHGQCGDGTQTGQTFTITSFASDGHGTAHLSCGVDCGWDFDIQTAAGNNVMSLVDINPENPDNYLTGTAVRKQ
jgi:hypothetical protein